MNTEMDASIFTAAAGFSPTELSVIIISFIFGTAMVFGMLAIVFGGLSAVLSGAPLRRLGIIAVMVLLVIAFLTVIIT